MKSLHFVVADPGGVMEEPHSSEWHASKGDQYKALCEYAKHIATLSAGSILLIATMLEKVFVHPHARLCVSVAVGAFLAALITSAIGFLMTAVMYPHSTRPRPGGTELTLMSVAMILTCMSFIVGVLAIAVFFWSNW